MSKSAVDKRVENARRELERAVANRSDRFHIKLLERKLESAMFEKRMAKANTGRAS